MLIFYCNVRFFVSGGKDCYFLLVINDYDTIYKVSICACNVHFFDTLTTKQSSVEDILTLSDSNPHFTIPSTNATLQVVINEISPQDQKNNSLG